MVAGGSSCYSTLSALAAASKSRRPLGGARNAGSFLSRESAPHRHRQPPPHTSFALARRPLDIHPPRSHTLACAARAGVCGQETTYCPELQSFGLKPYQNRGVMIESICCRLSLNSLSKSGGMCSNRFKMQKAGGRQEFTRRLNR